MGITIRKATPEDIDSISRLMVDAFAASFPGLRENSEKALPLIRESIVIDQFMMADRDSVPVGLFAVSDGIARMVRVDAKACRRHLGMVVGTVAAPILRAELEGKVALPAGGSLLEVLAVQEEKQGQGIGTAMLAYIKEHLPLPIHLEVPDNNPKALAFFRRHGFKEISRTKVSHAKEKGFAEKILLQYTT